MDLYQKTEDKNPSVSVGIEKINWFLENAPCIKMAERNKVLVANAVCSDIAFHIEGDDEYIPAHKVFIGMCSKELSKLSFGASNSEPIRIEKIHREDFMEVLKYIYTDVATINETNAFIIMKCANKLGLTPLENQCCEVLIDHITTSNACEYFKESFPLQNRLTVKSSIFIRNNIKVVLKSASFFQLSIAEISEILSKDFVSKTSNKTALFFAFLDWAESRCIADNTPVTAEQKRNIIGTRLDTIRFADMSANEFVSCINREPKFFNNSEIGDIVLQIAASQKTAKESAIGSTQSNNFGFSEFGSGSNSGPILSTNVFPFSSFLIGTGPTNIFPTK